MTRTEIAAAIDRLPAGERASLVEQLLDTLDADAQAALRVRLFKPEIAAFVAEVEKGFASGEGREMSDAEWEALLRGERTTIPRADSWARPPGRQESVPGARHD